MSQTSLFDKPALKLRKPIRLIELFAGIGAQAKALERIGANFERWFVCDFDRFAIASYNAVHGTDFAPSDRRLTPRECWRLMGFHDEDFDRAEKVNSNSQLYKQAGNSIVVDVLEAIFKEMML